jgi:hypothetical protein
MAEDVSPDHLKLFPLHDDVITRTVEIDDEYRLRMMYHLIWLREKATMLEIGFFYYFHFYLFLFLVRHLFVRLLVNYVIWILILLQIYLLIYRQVNIENLYVNFISLIVYSLFVCFCYCCFFFI